jgi:hypothetical protein
MRDTIDMAREAGNDDLFDAMQVAFLERLVALVRADEREAFAKIQFESLLQAMRIEREACARIVEESSLPDSYSEACLPEIAAFIRARGENT